jgi:hypothetical protein
MIVFAMLGYVYVMNYFIQVNAPAAIVVLVATALYAWSDSF